MAQARVQPVPKDILIFGDSNISRYLHRSGHQYSESAEVVTSRNLEEFIASADRLKVEDSDFKTVVFAMMTNIVISAGSTANCLTSRIRAIEDCLEPLVRSFRYLPSIRIFSLDIY